MLAALAGGLAASCALVAGCVAPALASVPPPPSAPSGAPTVSPDGASGTTGNGIASMTPAGALSAAATDLASQPNIVVAGSSSGDGDTNRIDVTSSNEGARTAGTIAVTAARLSLTLRFVILPRRVFVEGSRGFWTAAFATDRSVATRKRIRLARLLAGVWIAMTPKQGQGYLDPFGSLTSPRQLELGLLHTQGQLTWGSPQTIDGETALPAVADEGSTIWLPESGPLLPIEVTDGTATMSGTTGGAGTALRFEYPASVTIRPPARFAEL